MYLAIHLVDLTILSHRTLTSPRRTVELSAGAAGEPPRLLSGGRCDSVDVGQVPELNDLERGDTRRLSERPPALPELDAASS